MNTPNNNSSTYFEGLEKPTTSESAQQQTGLGNNLSHNGFMSPVQNGNTYAEQHSQRMQSEVLSEETAPDLTTFVNRSVNKKALTFLGVLALISIGAVACGLSKWRSNEEPKHSQEQTVTIPEVPQNNIPSTVTPNTPVDPNTKPIEVVQTPQPTAQPSSSVQISQTPTPVNPIIDLRRNSGNLVQIATPQQGSGNDDPNQGNNVRYLPNRDKMLVRGTYIRCVLETRIVTDVPGFTSCVITEPIYSVNGRTLLIPKGSKVSGKYASSNPTFPRVSVIWERILTPSGFDIALRSPGTDNQGGSGHPGEMTTHFAQRFANALLVSLISDAFTYASAEYSNAEQTTTTSSSTTTSPIESKSAKTLERAAIDELQRYGSRPNTVRINQGSVITIYTARDIDFSGINMQN